MNMMCNVYDLMLKLTSYNRININSEYKITEHFKENNTYFVNELKLEIEKDMLVFLDRDEFILQNGRAIAGIIIETIQDINIGKNIVLITFLDSDNNITIEFIR